MVQTGSMPAAYELWSIVHAGSWDGRKMGCREAGKWFQPPGISVPNPAPNNLPNDIYNKDGNS
jgi:hypothetical protein